MANPDEFLRDDQKKARERNSKLNQGANSFQGMGGMTSGNYDASQDVRNDPIKKSASDAAEKNKKSEAPKQQSIVQSEEKLKASKAKSSQQSNTLHQQQSQAKSAKEATKTQSEQEKKSKSM